MKGCTPGQLALAWLIAQPLDVAAISGTRRAAYVAENLAATSVVVSADEIAWLGRVFAPGTTAGDQYAPVHAAHVQTGVVGANDTVAFGVNGANDPLLQGLWRH